MKKITELPNNKNNQTTTEHSSLLLVQLLAHQLHLITALLTQEQLKNTCPCFCMQPLKPTLWHNEKSQQNYIGDCTTGKLIRQGQQRQHAQCNECSYSSATASFNQKLITHVIQFIFHWHLDDSSVYNTKKRQSNSGRQLNVKVKVKVWCGICYNA